jgi:hypothetical protein
MVMGQRALQFEDGKVPLYGKWKHAVLDNVPSSAFVVRTRGKISLNYLFTFDLIRRVVTAT